MPADSEVSLTPTRRIARLARLGTRRLTRAHLALQHRPGLAAAAQALLAPIASAIGDQIGAPVTLRARLLDGTFSPRASLAPLSGYAVFELSAANATAVLDLELPFLVAMLGRVAGAPGRIGPATTFTRIEEAAFGLVTLAGLTAVRRADAFERQFAPRLTALTHDRAEVLSRIDETLAYVALEVGITLADQSGVGRLLLPARTLQILSETFPSLPTPVPELPATVSRARIPAQVCAGTCALRADELRALQPGDVVLLGDLRVTAGQVHGAARVATALFDLSGELSPAGFVTQRGTPRAFPQEPPMSVNPAEPFPPLPLEVEVELTRLRLSVSELANLRAGSLVPLHINSSEPVVLRVGDRAVARAELVEIEGEVGARILALLP
ncbi:MAG: FliM/FliN family flagellar motor switch protein [Myxococcota bacterium]|nr:FliM/FliN family flagellar motor switch protein [Myxococcota bacterium]